jgi:hypothetical protein
MGHISFWYMLMMFIYWMKTINNKNKNTVALPEANKQHDLAVNPEKT